MVLATAEATLNAATDTLIDAWVVYVNLLAANEEIKIILCDRLKGDTAADSTQGTAAVIKAAFKSNRVYRDQNTSQGGPKDPNKGGGTGWVKFPSGQAR